MHQAMKHDLMRSAAPLERKDADEIIASVKNAIDNLGKDFEEFKSANDQRLKEVEKKGSADTLIEEKMGRISDSLDKFTEQKAAFEAALAAERKEREDLEARINRHGIQANSAAEAKSALELKEFNLTLGALAQDRRKPFTPLDSAGLDQYKSAFESWVRYGEAGLSETEKKTLSVGTDADGGYFVNPDTSGRIVSKVYETSPMRQICDQQTISTDKFEGMEDLDEAGAGYAGENTTSGNETTPQVGKWDILVYWIDTQPKASQQLLDDSAVDVEGWLARKVSARFSRFENSEFVAGTSGKIRGFTSYDKAADSGSGVTWGKLGYQVSGASGAFASSNPADKLHDLVGLLKNEYLMNASWVTRRSVITAIRKFKDGQGQYLWQPSLQAGQPESLLGYPVSRMEDMPALAADSYSLAFGDFREGYTIVDRQGVKVLRDPYTSKPKTIFYTTKRTGGGVLNFEAIKLMKFGTS